METNRETSVNMYTHTLSEPYGSTAIFQLNSGKLLPACSSERRRGLNLHISTNDKKNGTDKHKSANLIQRPGHCYTL